MYMYLYVVGWYIYIHNYTYMHFFDWLRTLHI